MKTARLFIFGAASAVVLTAVGVADADGVVGYLLLSPGRAFDRILKFDSGPPEVGVVYGLAANVICLFVLVIAIAFMITRRMRRRRTATDSAT